ncbi:hypothetical protein [Nocardia cyriacigeorgica]|uniref:hypothetical protein n=1 Tax=Nocardia cyriacigeorgica TaxID=135487 RepID=UPI002455E0F4|nr:hypothetical protein [Nocardia cyriacigeorgica]
MRSGTVRDPRPYPGGPLLPIRPRPAEDERSACGCWLGEFCTGCRTCTGCAPCQCGPAETDPEVDW